MQRLLDLLISITAIIILSPLLIPVCIVLRFSGEGEIFFLQDRVGQHRSIFKIFKFATMLKDSPFVGTGTLTVKDDPRVLPVGKFLRKTKINELPQLINILRGDMSFIGPRPVAQRAFDVYSEEVKVAISQVIPGLSGIGSIIFRDEESLMTTTDSPAEFYDTVIAPYKGELENWYVSKMGIYTYVVLFFLTILVVISPKTKLVWKVFSDLPKPSEKLKNLLA